MSDLIPYSYNSLNEDHIEFLVTQLANPTLKDELMVQAAFEQFFKISVDGAAIMRIKREKAAEIKAYKDNVYNDLYNIPVSHAYVRLSVCQSRIEYHLSNLDDKYTLKQIVPTVINIDGKNVEVEKESPVLYERVNDRELREWVKLAQTEQLLNEKIKLEMIVKKIEDEGIANTGFTPVRVNTRITDV